MSSLPLIILGMAIGTYLSRVTPLFLLPKEGLPDPVERLLRYVPPAALGALVFPDVFYGPAGHEAAAIIAAAVATFLAMRSRALWVTVGGGILVTFLAIQFAGV